ncbi:golgin subfamily A member 6-like protein 25 [Pungitius pungitius]|uniref:golgin subfamily A member 6-like protein 25 n=1 Tax=Pungitius pungitius TaxID=134920 RepID=UPI002E0F485C
MSDFTEETRPQQQQQQREKERRSPVSPPRQVKGGEDASCIQGSLLEATPTTGVTDPPSFVDGVGSDSKTSNAMRSNVQSFDEPSDVLSKTEQSWRLDKTQTRGRESMKENNQLPCEQQTGQLVKELEQTRKDFSRLQQLNRNLQDELQQERARHSRERAQPENDLPSNSIAEQASAFQRLQKINHDLRLELEAKTRSQEKAREVELRQRVDLLAQQAQLLVTGDATALAQAHLDQDRLRFHEQRTEWERCVASLETQLSASDEKRKEAEVRSAQLQQELRSYHTLQQEAERLHKHLREVTNELRANEEAQAQKEARLQKHLTLLQESQDRERRSLASGLAEAEQHSRELQERLDRAEQHVEGLNKTPTWTREIEEAQQLLQEELACTVSAVRKLQEEKEQLDRRCGELQSQLCEADGEVSRLQSRLKTEETDYYNLEHSFERVSEDLQLALGKVQQSESETQDIREGYERLLDRKEQELGEVLLKMEILGNSLEETEVKLSEVLKGCTCNPSQPKDEHLEPARQNERQTDLTTSSSRPREINSANAGDDPERFLSVIQILETKLYITEEKLRDIMQCLREHHGHPGCQDPHLCSQLTQSRASAQHLSLLLHSQAKQSKRFARDTENRCRELVGRFHFALNVVRACRETLQGTQINVTDLEKQLAAVASCLRRGEEDAEKHQRESRRAGKGEDKILQDEVPAGAEGGDREESEPDRALPSGDGAETVGKCLVRELFVVEKMLSVLQSGRGVARQPLEPGADGGDLAHKYKSIIWQRIALKAAKGSNAWRAGCDQKGCVERAIGGACAEAELICAALACPQQSNSQEAELQREALADTDPPELAPYEREVQGENNESEGAAKAAERDEADVQRVEAQKSQWLKRLMTRLQRRAKFLQRLCQELT